MALMPQISNSFIKISVFYILFIQHLSAMKTLQNHQIPYEIIQEIGSGSSASVHKGFSRKTGKKYAIKQIQYDIINEPLLQNQITIHQTLKNEHIVQFIESFKLQKQIWIVMELCDGSLADLIQKKSLSQAEIQKISVQLFKVISEINDMGVHHLDLKPQNILYVDDYFLKISDFGCSEFQGNQGSSMNFGTSKYMPPEIRLGTSVIDKAKVDVWSFGVILYQMVFGIFPVQNEEHLQDICQGKKSIVFPEISSTSKKFVFLIKKTLQLDPRDRPTWGLIKHIFINILNRDPLQFKKTSQLSTLYLETSYLLTQLLQAIKKNLFYHTDHKNEYSKKHLNELSRVLAILGHLYSRKFTCLFGKGSQKLISFQKSRKIEEYSKFFGSLMLELGINKGDLQVWRIDGFKKDLEKVVKSLFLEYQSQTEHEIYKSYLVLSIFLKDYLKMPKNACLYSERCFSETLKLLRK